MAAPSFLQKALMPIPINSQEILIIGPITNLPNNSVLIKSAEFGQHQKPINLASRSRLLPQLLAQFLRLRVLLKRIEGVV